MAARLADAVRLAQDAAVLLERGRADEALERYREGIALTQRAAAKDAALAPAAALIGDELRSKLAAARRGGDAPATTYAAGAARPRRAPDDPSEAPAAEAPAAGAAAPHEGAAAAAAPPAGAAAADAPPAGAAAADAPAPAPAAPRAIEVPESLVRLEDALDEAQAARLRARPALVAAGPRPTPKRAALDAVAAGADPSSLEALRLLLGPELIGAVPATARTMDYSGATVATVGLLWRGGRPAPAPPSAAERRRARNAEAARARAEAPLPPEVGVLPSLALLPRDVLWDLKGQADELEARELRRRRPAAPAEPGPTSWRGPVPPVTPSERYHAVDAYDLGDAAAAAADEALEEMTLRARRWAEDAARDAADLDAEERERARLADAGEPLPPRTYGADLAALYPVPDAPGDGDAAAAGDGAAGDGAAAAGDDGDGDDDDGDGDDDEASYADDFDGACGAPPCAEGSPGGPAPAAAAPAAAADDAAASWVAGLYGGGSPRAAPAAPPAPAPAPAAPAPAVPAAPDLPPCRPAFCVVKYVDARECRGASAAARARTVGSYANELAVLRDLSGVFAAARVWTPRVLACETDGDRYLVALEALLPPAFSQRPTLPAEHCVQALRWLARFHAFGHRLAASGFGDLGVWPLGGHTPLAHRPPGEVEGLERGYDKWLLAFCDEKRFRVPPNDFGARLAAQARRVDGWIADACGPRRTLVHGDFKAGNLFVEDATRRVFAIDWQWCGWGCGLHDVVYFFATTAADDFVKDFDDALWLYHYALVEELEPELRAAAPWPYPETRRLFMLAALDYVRWCFAYRLVDETPRAYKRRAAAEPRDINQGEYRRSFRRLRYLCDLAEQFLPYAESGALGVSLQDLALLDL